MQVKYYFRTLAVTSLFSLAASSAFAQAPAIFTGGVVNAADYSSDLAPGAIISVFGRNLASSTQVAAQTPLPTFLVPLPSM